MTAEPRRYTRMRRALPAALIAVSCLVFVAALLAFSLGSPATLPVVVGLALVSVGLLVLALLRLRER